MSHTPGGVTPRSEHPSLSELKMQGKIPFSVWIAPLPAHLLFLDVAHTPCEIYMQGLGINRPVDSDPVTFVPCKKHFAMITRA
jgi:hypothetical protein